MKILLCLLSLLLVSCQEREERQFVKDNGLIIKNTGKDATLHIVDYKGHKFAILMKNSIGGGCAIVEIKDN